MDFHFSSYWNLLWGMVARDLRNRYLGSFGGKAWNVLFPLLTITIYTNAKFCTALYYLLC